MANCCLTKSARTGGSGIRPEPSSPQARRPLSGSGTMTPRSRRTTRFICRRMLQHRGVHRRRDNHRTAVGDGIRRERIVGQTDGELGQHVGGGRRHQKQIGPARQLDVIDAAVSGSAPLFDDDAVAGDRRQRQRRYESRGVRREDDPHLGAYIAQASDDVRRFIRRNPAGDAEDDACGCGWLVTGRGCVTQTSQPETALLRFQRREALLPGGVSCHFTCFFSISSMATRVACVLALLFGMDPARAARRAWLRVEIKSNPLSMPLANLPSLFLQTLGHRGDRSSAVSGCKFLVMIAAFDIGATFSSSLR